MGSFLRQLIALAPVASAHGAAPPAGPLIPCGAIATRVGDWDIAWNGSGNGHYLTHAKVQEKANSDGSGCGSYRVKISIWAQSGYRYVSTFGVLRRSGVSVGGSGFNDSTVYTGASSWRDFYGPWVSSTCTGGGIYGYGGAYVYPQNGDSGQGGGLTYLC